MDDILTWESVASEYLSLPKKNDYTLKLSARPDPYIVRLVSIPKATRIHYEAFRENEHKCPVSPAINNYFQGADIAWNLGGWVPSPRFITVVIDRESKTPKTISFGRQLFNEFVAYMKENGVDPSGENAPDFKIYVQKTHAWNEMRVTPVSQGHKKPLTDIEMASSSALLKIAQESVKTASPSEIRDLWMALPKEKKYSEKALKKAQSRNGFGSSTEENVISYIKKYSDSIYVPALHKGEMINVTMSDIDEAWFEAYLSYYVDFGILPNRYLTEEDRGTAVLDEIADALELRWLDPNQENFE